MLKKGDFIWGGMLVCWAIVLAVPSSREIFVMVTNSHPYLIAFIKFAVLASMGEFLTLRILNGYWMVPKYPLARAIIWGILGMAFVLMFEVFYSGIESALSKGLLLVPNSTFARAFFTSAVMNLAFAPTFMAFHRITDTYLDIAAKNNSEKPKLKDVIKEIGWNNFTSFVILKTIPFWWIPAHTITFMLPSVFRVITAAFLSIALGLILSFAKWKPGYKAKI
jgi:hypothetical protein